MGKESGKEIDRLRSRLESLQQQLSATEKQRKALEKENRELKRALESIIARIKRKLKMG